MNWIRFVPFLGRLSECSWEDLGEAIREVGLTILAATMPLWFLPALSPVFFKIQISPYGAVKTGELFLYSTAVVGPLIYIISKNYGEKANDGKGILSYTIRFPYGGWFVGACVGMGLISSFAFVLLRNPLLEENQLSRIINYDGVVGFSWVTFILSIFILFCATSYRNTIDNARRDLTNQERDFSRQWEAEK